MFLNILLLSVIVVILYIIIINNCCYIFITNFGCTIIVTIDVNNVVFTLFIVEEKYASVNVIYFSMLFIIINNVKK